ncbi:MAG: PSD1 and planctomycete cytochrome C domain-containing protein [Pirellulales bacterium]
MHFSKPMRLSWYGGLLLAQLFMASVGSVDAAGVKPSGDDLAELLFVKKVQPLFVEKCGGCHGERAKPIKGSYDMRSRATLLAGGESEEVAVVAGQPDQSPLLAAVQWINGMEMPPKENDRLTHVQIQWIRQWIAAGAPWPTADRRKQLSQQSWPETGTAGQIVKTSGGQSEQWTHRLYLDEHLWAYRSLGKPTIPTEFAAATGNGVDVFVNRKLSAAKLDSAPRADKRTLIRRATFDLTGLPPTAEEIQNFLADESPTAFAKLIDRLLESDRYGEQWGRHWLDVVRYADSAGFSNDYARPNAWRYRDYVIRAFNADKPYDQFIREQVAGDELAGDNPEHLIATGFLRMGPWEHTGMSVAAVTRQQYLDDITNIVGVTYLGQELRCAKCHDHKFDPIPTLDYYRMQAVFSPLQFADRDAAYLAVENTSAFATEKARLERLRKVDGVRGLDTVPHDQWPVDTFDADSETKGHDKVNKKREECLDRERKRYQPLALSVYSGPSRKFTSKQSIVKMPNRKQRKGKVAPIHLLLGGSIETPGVEVAPGVLSLIAGLQTELVSTSNEPVNTVEITKQTQGRRLDLANWLASPKNPLTARVMVNRIWQYHFGCAIAGNPNNFGQTGQKPSHPELLDFLARAFISSGWSIKKMHRVMMLSEVYQRSSRHPQAEQVSAVDPDNRLLTHFSPRRMTAEELRDTMLFVSQELNLEMGGLPARPMINLEAAMQPRHIMGSVGPAYQAMPTPAQRNRRTVYTQRTRTMRDPMMEVFNQPDLDLSCERRDSSTISPQVFTLFNGQNTHDRALAMADWLRQKYADVESRIDSAIELAYGRPATIAERVPCLSHYLKIVEHHRGHPPERTDLPEYVIREMVEEMTGLHFYWVEDLDVYRDYVPDLKPWDVSAETRALADICLVLLNSNEFIYVY